MFFLVLNQGGRESCREREEVEGEGAKDLDRQVEREQNFPKFDPTGPRVPTVVVGTGL